MKINSVDPCMKKKTFDYDACVIATSDEKGSYVDLLVDRFGVNDFFRNQKCKHDALI